MQSQVPDAKPPAPAVSIIMRHICREAEKPGESHFRRVAHEAIAAGRKLSLSASWVLIPTLRRVRSLLMVSVGN